MSEHSLFDVSKSLKSKARVSSRGRYSRPSSFLQAVQIGALSGEIETDNWKMNFGDSDLFGNAELMQRRQVIVSQLTPSRSKVGHWDKILKVSAR